MSLGAETQEMPRHEPGMRLAGRACFTSLEIVFSAWKGGEKCLTRHQLGFLLVIKRLRFQGSLRFPQNKLQSLDVLDCSLEGYLLASLGPFGFTSASRFPVDVPLKIRAWS